MVNIYPEVKWCTETKLHFHTPCTSLYWHTELLKYCGLPALVPVTEVRQRTGSPALNSSYMAASNHKRLCCNIHGKIAVTTITLMVTKLMDLQKIHPVIMHNYGSLLSMIDSFVRYLSLHSLLSLLKYSETSELHIYYTSSNRSCHTLPNVPHK